MGVFAGQLGKEPQQGLPGGADLPADADVLKGDAPQAQSAPPPQGADGDLLAVDLGQVPRGLGQRDQLFVRAVTASIESVAFGAPIMQPNLRKRGRRICCEEALTHLRRSVPTDRAVFVPLMHPLAQLPDALAHLLNLGDYLPECALGAKMAGRRRRRNGD